MARLFFTDIDLTGNHLLNVVVDVLAARPATNLVAGRLIYNSTSAKLEYYTGSAWITLDNVPTSLGGYTAVQLLDRANHTGLQLAATISNFDTQVRASRLDQMAVPTASVSLNNQKVTNLATPTVSTDAANMSYVLAQISALVAAAPGTLDTLNEIAAALGDDANYAASVTAAITAAKARANHTGTQLASTISDFATTADARIAASGYAADIGNAVLTAIPVVHNLNTRDVIVRVRSNTTPWAFVETDVEATDANTVTLRFTVAPTAAQYRAIVQKVS